MRTDPALAINTPDTTAPPLSLRTREAAAALGISERTLQTLTAGGDIPHVKLGRANLYPVRELADWLTARAEGSSSAGAEGGTR